MAKHRNRPAIGFPAPLLGERSQRLEVLGRGDGWVALAKPAGVGVRAHPWDAGVPNLDEGLNVQLAAGKPELAEYAADLFGSVYYVEPESSGAALFATTRASLDCLRNACGSAEMGFRFCFVSRLVSGDEVGLVRASDAPLLEHDWKLKMIPSTAKGKRAATEFRCLRVSRLGWALWEARTRYPRMHQIRAHAALVGVPVLGDVLYGGAEVPTLADLMPKKRGPGLAATVFDGLALHLWGVEMPSGGEVEAPFLRNFEVLLKRLGLNA